MIRHAITRIQTRPPQCGRQPNLVPTMRLELIRPKSLPLKIACLPISPRRHFSSGGENRGRHIFPRQLSATISGISFALEPVFPASPAFSTPRSRRRFYRILHHTTSRFWRARGHISQQQAGDENTANTAVVLLRKLADPVAQKGYRQMPRLPKAGPTYPLRLAVLNQQPRPIAKAPRIWTTIDRQKTDIPCRFFISRRRGKSPGNQRQPAQRHRSNRRRYPGMPS